MKTIPLELNGLTDIPPGKIANVAILLQMFAPPAGFSPMRAPFGYGLERIKGAEIERYRKLFRTVGNPWLWYSRLQMSDEELADTLDNRDVEAFALAGAGGDIGILELDFREPGEVELAFFGLVPGAIGGGLGRYLMAEAIARGFVRGSKRMWVHTCNFDHPKAMDFYIKSGFEPYSRAIEIADDPRLTGLLPRSAAPHVPLIEPQDNA